MAAKKVSLRQIARSVGLHHQEVTEVLKRIHDAVMNAEEETIVITQDAGTFYKQRRKATRRFINDQFYDVPAVECLQLRASKNNRSTVDDDNEGTIETLTIPVRNATQREPTGPLFFDLTNSSEPNQFVGNETGIEVRSVTVLRGGFFIPDGIIGGLTVDLITGGNFRFPRSEVLQDELLTDWFVDNGNLVVPYEITNANDLDRGTFRFVEFPFVMDLQIRVELFVPSDQLGVRFFT